MIIWCRLNKIIMKWSRFHIRRGIDSGEILVYRLNLLLPNYASTTVSHYYLTIVYGIISGVRWSHLTRWCRLIRADFMTSVGCYLLILPVLFLEILYLLEYLTRILNGSSLHQTGSAADCTLILRFLSANHGWMLLLPRNSHLILLNYALCKIRGAAFEILRLYWRRRMLRRYDLNVLLRDLFWTQSSRYVVYWRLPTVMWRLLLLKDCNRRLSWGSFSMTRAWGIGWIRMILWVFSRACSRSWYRHWKDFLFFRRLRYAHITRWRLIW